MHLIFKDQKLQKIRQTHQCKSYPAGVVRGYIKVLTYIKHASGPKDFLALQSLRFEKLHAYPKGDYSMRINDQYRVVFNLHEQEIVIVEITELSKHYT